MLVNGATGMWLGVRRTTRKRLNLTSFLDSKMLLLMTSFTLKEDMNYWSWRVSMLATGPHFKIKTVSCMRSRYKHKTVVRPSYLYNSNYHFIKIVHSYWNTPADIKCMTIKQPCMYFLKWTISSVSLSFQWHLGKHDIYIIGNIKWN